MQAIVAHFGVGDGAASRLDIEHTRRANAEAVRCAFEEAAALDQLENGP